MDKLNLLHPSLGLAFTSEFGDTRWFEATAKCLQHHDDEHTEDAEDLGGFPLGDDEE